MNSSLLLHLIDGGYLPVVSPVSRNIGHELGPALNVNADDAAAAIAVALEASELLIVSDVPGVLVEDGRASTLTVDLWSLSALCAHTLDEQPEPERYFECKHR